MLPIGIRKRIFTNHMRKWTNIFFPACAPLLLFVASRVIDLNLATLWSRCSYTPETKYKIIKNLWLCFSFFFFCVKDPYISLHSHNPSQNWYNPVLLYHKGRGETHGSTQRVKYPLLIIGRGEKLQPKSSVTHIAASSTRGLTYLWYHAMGTPQKIKMGNKGKEE